MSQTESLHKKHRGVGAKQVVLLVDDDLNIRAEYHGLQDVCKRLGLKNVDAVRQIILKKEKINGNRLMKEQEFNTLKKFAE